MSMKEKGLAALGWAAGATFAFYTVAWTYMSHSIFVFLIGVVLVGICLPPTRKVLKDKAGLTIRGRRLVGACTALGLLMIGFNIAGALQVEEAKEAKAKQEAAERLAKSRIERTADYGQNKEAILADINAKRTAGDFAGASALISKYSWATKDPGLVEAERALTFDVAKSKLKNVSSMKLNEAADLYKTLAEGEPGNAAYAAKLVSLNKQLAAQAVALERKKAFDAQFSSWDGSHTKLEAAVKANMKNPSSYEHVSTSRADTGKKFLVRTTYRGTNSFGGVVPNTVLAEVDISGNVLRMGSE